MEKSTRMGSNRTGIDISPMDSKKMVSGAQQYSPRPVDGSQRYDMIHRQYLESAGSVGSVPLPGTMKGALKSMAEKLTGSNPEVLINKLGERLAFERSGVRLYDSFIRKCASLSNGNLGPVSLEKLQEIREEEFQHFHLLKQAMETLGCDPTAQTPDADVSGVATMGMMKAIQDPRTSLSQCLEVMLSVELTDNAAWEVLIALCDEMGMGEMSERFMDAARQEQDHERTIRQWYMEAVTSQSRLGQDTRH